MMAIALAISSHATVVGQTPLRLDDVVPIPLQSVNQSTARQPQLIRPRPHVIDAAKSPAIAILTGNEDAPLPQGTSHQDSSASTNAYRRRPSDDTRLTRPGFTATRTTRPLTATSARPDVSIEDSGRPASIEEALEKKGTVTFRKTPLSEVVFLLSELWQINIVAGENVTGEVSGAFHDAPLREVLSAALTATGYSYRKTGSSLIVLPIDSVGSDDPSFVSELIPLPQGIRESDDTIEAARLLLGERGELRRVGTSGVLVVDNPERVERVRQLFTELSPRLPATPQQNPAVAAPPTNNVESVVQSGIAYFTPQFTEAEQMSEPLTAALGENVVVAVFPEENRIMVKGDPAQLKLAKEAIAQLDLPRPQVRITAMIYDVGLSELEELGVNFSRDLRVIANARNEALENVTDNISSIFVFTSDLATSGAAQAGIRSVKDTLEASALLQLLDSTAEAKLLADPSITVGDRHEASIRIVRRIPIVGANPVQNSNAVFTQTEFEEAGVILKVKPRISQDGTIELAVSPEYSVVAELTETGPVIDSRTADTTVRVANGQMFVLGGLRQKSIVESVRGIPYLKDLKYLGKLFRSHDTDIRESELIVFLKPELVTPYSVGSAREQRAACVASQLLDRIPHASCSPQAPYCHDAKCPNHHPRPRINGGSPSLEMLGGFGLNEQVISETVIQGDPTRQPTPAPAARPELPPQPATQVLPAPVSDSRTDYEVSVRVNGQEQDFAPVHVDPAFRQ